jgi:hypothetical protein
VRKVYDRFVLGSVCSLMIAVTFVARSGAEIDTAHVVGAWLLDENEGNVAKDVSGDGNDGKLLNGAKWDAGKFGSGLLFDGVDDNVQIPSSAGDKLNPDTQITIAAWIQRHDAEESPGYMIVGRMDTVQSRTYYLAFWENKFQMEVSHDGTAGNRTVMESIEEIVDMEWHHLAGTFDGEEMIIYVDGSLAGQAPPFIAGEGGIHQNDSDVFIGYDKVDGGFFFNGLIDEVIILDIALAEKDIVTLMEDGLRQTLVISPAGNLATLWATLKRSSH